MNLKEQAACWISRQTRPDVDYQSYLEGLKDGTVDLTPEVIEFIEWINTKDHAFSWGSYKRKWYNHDFNKYYTTSELFAWWKENVKAKEASRED